VSREAADRSPHRVQADRSLRTAAARVLGGIGGEEPSEGLGGQLRDGRRRPGLGEPGCERSAVPAVLADGVRRSTVGFELEKERLECGLDVHVGHAAMRRPRTSRRIPSRAMQQEAVRAGERGDAPHGSSGAAELGSGRAVVALVRPVPRAAMRCIRALLIATTLAEALVCQGAGPSWSRTFAERLHSKSARTVAWAAHDIISLKLRTQTRHLESSLQAWGTRNGEEADVVRLHLLDALIQSGAKVPGSTVLPHVGGSTEVSAFVLLARDPRQNETELRAYFFSQPSNEFHSIAWWAAGNLLCAQRAPGFGAWLLKRTKFELEIDVVSPGDPMPLRCGGAVALDTGSEPHLQLRGFPPVPVYCFKVGSAEPWTTPEPLGEDVIAPGRSPVRFQRRVCRERYRAGRSSHNRDDGLITIWLADLAPGCDSWGTRIETVEFTTPEAFVGRVQTVQRQFVQNQRDLTAALVASGALAISEAAEFKVNSDFKLNDYRSNAQCPFPEVRKELDPEYPTGTQRR
jgi:hypothetical protein